MQQEEVLDVKALLKQQKATTTKKPVVSDEALQSGGQYSAENLERYRAVERNAREPVRQSESIKGNSESLKRKVTNTLSKEAKFFEHEDPTLLKRKAINFNSDDDEDSGEFEMDLEGWKANLSKKDKERLKQFCRYDPFNKVR